MSKIDTLEEGGGTSFSLSMLLDITLSCCEKELNNSTTGPLKISSKKKLMHSFLKTKIILSRYLTILRWAHKARVSESFKNLRNAFEENSGKTLEAYRQIRKAKRGSELAPINLEIPNFAQKFNIQIENFSFRDTLLLMLQRNLPSAITNISYSMNRVYVSASSIYSYSFKISKKTKISLLNYSLQFPFNEMFIPQITKMLSNEFKSIDIFDDFFLKVHQIFVYLRSVGHFLEIVSLLREKERVFGFTLTNCKGAKAVISFGKNNFDFNVYASEFGVSLFSSRSLNGSFYSCILSKDNMEEVLSEIRESIVKTRLSEIQSMLIHTLIIGGFPSFACDFRGNGISVDLLGKSFAFIYLSDTDSSLQVVPGESFDIKKEDFIDFLESKDESEQVVFTHKLYLKKIAMEMLFSITSNAQEYIGEFSHFNTITPRELKYSFAPNFAIRILNSTKFPYVDIIDSDGDVLITNEMALLSAVPSNMLQCGLRNAILSAKRFIALLQLKKILEKQKIETRLEKGKLYFRYSNFADVCFKVGYTGDWKISITRKLVARVSSLSTICVFGHGYSANFCNEIVCIIWIISRQINLLSDVHLVNETSRFVGQVISQSDLDFSFKLHIKSIPTFFVKVTNVELVQSNDSLQIYEIPSNHIVPTLCQTQALNTPFNTLSRTIVKVPVPEILYNDAIMLMSNHLSLVYALFSHNSNWSIQEPVYQSIQLIYKKTYTINISVSAVGIYFIRVPLTKNHEILQVPLSACGKVKMTQVAFTICVFIPKSLQIIKRSVEEFFSALEVLNICNFTKRQIIFDKQAGMSIMKFEPQSVNGLEASVTLTAGEFKVEYSGSYVKKVNAIRELGTVPLHNRSMFSLIVGSLTIGVPLATAIFDGIPKLYHKVDGIDWQRTFSTIKMSNKMYIQLGLFYGERRIILEFGLDKKKPYILVIETKKAQRKFLDFDNLIDYLNS